MAPRSTAKTPAKKAAQPAKTPAKKATATPVTTDDLPRMQDVSFDQVDNGTQARADETRRVEEDQPTGMVTADGQALQTAEVTFRGRTMVVRVPNEGQLAVMKRFSAEYSAMSEGQSIDAKKAIAMSGRAIGIVQCVLADDDDMEWIADSILMDDFGIMDALPIVQEAMKQLKLVNIPNREERRATKKARLVTE